MGNVRVSVGLVCRRGRGTGSLGGAKDKVRPLRVEHGSLGGSMTSGPDEQVARRGPRWPRSIPPEHFGTILQPYKGGLSYLSIANHLRGLGVGATHTTVSRVIESEEAYPRSQ